MVAERLIETRRKYFPVRSQPTCGNVTMRGVQRSAAWVVSLSSSRVCWTESTGLSEERGYASFSFSTKCCSSRETITDNRLGLRSKKSLITKSNLWVSLVRREMTAIDRGQMLTDRFFSATTVGSAAG